ncbi:MAG: hypothetical protein N2319_07480 [Candidatus Kapabacteria bacterium]|nr:hypothetical protein [Candidatus Kapabacteria bacterium]
MSEYEVYFSKSAVKEIESLDTQIISRISDRMTNQNKEFFNFLNISSEISI